MQCYQNKWMEDQVANNYIYVNGLKKWWKSIKYLINMKMNN